MVPWIWFTGPARRKSTQKLDTVVQFSMVPWNLCKNTAINLKLFGIWMAQPFEYRTLKSKVFGLWTFIIQIVTVFWKRPTMIRSTTSNISSTHNSISEKICKLISSSYLCYFVKKNIGLCCNLTLLYFIFYMRSHCMTKNGLSIHYHPHPQSRFGCALFNAQFNLCSIIFATQI